MKPLMYKVFDPNATESDGSCLGEVCFLRKKLWKLAVMLGYDFTSNVLTTNGLSFSHIIDNSDTVNEITSFLDNNGVEYKMETSLNGWDTIIKVSKSKRNLNILDKLYIEFYEFYNDNTVADVDVKTKEASNEPAEIEASLMDVITPSGEKSEPIPSPVKNSQVYTREVVRQ